MALKQDTEYPSRGRSGFSEDIKMLFRNLLKCIALLLIAGIYGCERSIVIHLRFILEKDAPTPLRIIEDPGLPLDTSKIYVLHAKHGTVTLPAGFLRGLSGSDPVFYEVEGVYDRLGRLLSVGEDPPKGQLGIRGMVGQAGPKEERKTGHFENYYFIVSR